ncbi:bifunctional lysylphosphatidylglycerol flippase/synthetase MprF [Pseudosulfitobacter sp. DSM 107133]|uniref:bifunctional lysylphosphatidylglycerol flippase/synthetase MprF n=1 Tax=Pseudosulfitobacter sp. DSM 107133 TaxID=2883100 RepID=UPI000DF3587B|nr:bifunctional lysylphosphatidylglycerol flippase/synthetase MprF [Pseudosulfitobacter sp. DSM 107133]UOA25334.1 Phosphatidylglycerol lysyltransferase [Pseudosulfitobacter sp. DSM 107133]
MSQDNKGTDMTDRETGSRARRLLRQHAPLILTGVLFIGGVYALYHLLAPLDMRVVLAQLRATPPHLIAGALAATAVGYIALIGYDWSALRYIGKTAPASSIALGGFLGYALGNTIGLSLVSGGAVRYRIYSALGLDAYDVAAISTFAAMSFGIGSTLIGLGAVAVHPAALQVLVNIAPETLRLIAIGLLVVSVIALGVISQWGGTFSWGGFKLSAPRGRDLLRQLAITGVDMVMAALVLHLLLPTGALPFANMLAVFAVATMVGVASHVPGGIGVFESVVIAALPATVPVNDAVTALLLFRLIYFLLPFVLALLLLSLTEVWSAAGSRLPTIPGLAPMVLAGRSLIPMATGFLVLASGLFMMFAGLIPNPTGRAEELETLLPLTMVEGGPLVSSIIGSLLAVLSVSVFRRSRLAYWAVLVALLVGVVVAALKTQDLDRVMVLAMMALILWPCRREFYRRARLTQGVLSVRWLVFTLSTLTSLGLLWYLVHTDDAARDLMWWQVAGDGPAVAAWRAALTAGVILSAALLYSGFRVARVKAPLPDAAAFEAAQRIINTYGTGSDVIALTGDKMLMFGPAQQSVLSYGIKGGSWIVMGGPVGAQEDVEDLSWAFHDAARAAGARPVFYETSAAFTEQAIDMGLTLHKMGEEAVVPLPDFSLEGPERKKLRASWNRAQRDGLSVEIVSPPHAPELIATLQSISDDWMAQHAAREKRFSVGRFDEAWLNRTRIALVRLNGEICAFGNLMEAPRSSAVDMMRHRADAPSATMEFLFTELMLQLKAEGRESFSLGMVPFAGLSGRRGATLWARFGSLVYSHGDRFYSFEGLRRFKSKFDPVWQPRYFCCRSALPPVGPLTDAARLIAGSARGIVGK